jgi:hypothetical protein
MRGFGKGLDPAHEGEPAGHPGYDGDLQKSSHA